MNRILNEILEYEKLTEAHTSYSENFEENIRRSKKSHQRNADENKNLTIQ